MFYYILLDPFASIVFSIIYSKVLGSYKLTQVYSRYPCEKLLMERIFVKSG